MADYSNDQSLRRRQFFQATRLFLIYSGIAKDYSQIATFHFPPRFSRTRAIRLETARVSSPVPRMRPEAVHARLGGEEFSTWDIVYVQSNMLMHHVPAKMRSRRHMEVGGLMLDSLYFNMADT
jgi:hypothetical protein